MNVCIDVLPIIRAIRDNDLNKVKELLSTGIDPNGMDKYKNTPLCVAIGHGHLDIVKELLSVGANPNIVDRFDRTPLHYAVCLKRSGIIKELLSARANPNIMNKSDHTPLHYAIQTRCIKIIKMLLSAGADPNIVRCGRNLFQEAFDSNNPNIIKVFEDYLPSFHLLTMRCVRRNNINISTLPVPLTLTSFV